MENPNISDSNPVTNKVEVDLHMLRALVLNRVGGEVHDADVVAVDERALGERAVELTQELSKPGRLCHAVSNSSVLRLGTGAGDNRLPLGRPGDQVATQVESSKQSLTRCREETHSSRPAGAQAKCARAQARGPCAP